MLLQVLPTHSSTHTVVMAVNESVKEDFVLQIDGRYRVRSKNHRQPLYFRNRSFNESNGHATIRVKWKNACKENNVVLEDLFVTQEQYLHDLIPWVLNIISINDMGDTGIQIWLNTNSDKRVGSFV